MNTVSEPEWRNVITLLFYGVFISSLYQASQSGIHNTGNPDCLQFWLPDKHSCLLRANSWLGQETPTCNKSLCQNKLLIFGCMISQLKFYHSKSCQVKYQSDKHSLMSKLKRTLTDDHGNSKNRQL